MDSLQHVRSALASVIMGMAPVLGKGDQWSTVDAQWAQLIGLIRCVAHMSTPVICSVTDIFSLLKFVGGPYDHTSVVPPLIYAVMGTSREIAIGPVAVVSLLLSSMMEKLVDPATDPVGYTKLILLATLFAGIFQTSFGLLRLGFLVDFLSHAAIVGFVAGAAIVIGLQQLKGLLGITNFLTKTDIVSVMKAVWEAVHNPGKRKKKLFWLASISPLVSVVVSTLIVFITRADKNGVKIVKHVKGGLNPRSIHQLDFNNPYIGEVAKIGLVVAVVALTVRLIDLSEAYKIWKVDKIDFLACAGAFFGVLFASVEIGLLAAVIIATSISAHSLLK
ncbi:hypothetical protein JHK87_049306 [Glycine soja]|nr:hypothetical protein JHK87_049306 [Glycine soja]